MLWKFASWNVNGLRAIERKGLLRPFIEEQKPDVLCLQEVKIDEDSHSGTGLVYPSYN